MSSKFFKAFKSWRTTSVSLLSFASGLPLGLVWISIPDWLRSNGVDLAVVGLFSLTQLPWSLKPLWAPLLDRYAPHFWGRRRTTIALTQILLSVFLFIFAGLGNKPDLVFVVAALTMAIAFASATQDIMLDGYAVEVLEKDEQAVAVGARTALYRSAMYVSGALSISLISKFGWAWVCALMGVIFLPFVILTKQSPEPTVKPFEPKTLNEAVWVPLKEIFLRKSALQILLFVVLYKFADNLGQALLRPFLVDCGYSAVDRGVALGTIGLFATLLGTFVGGVLTSVIGLGRSLWVCGFLQIFSNLGYVFVAQSEVNRPLMYAAMGFETFTQGLGAGAFSVLLMRLTQKEFSVTQYALLSSLFAIPRVFTGPLSALLTKTVGWENFFYISMLAGIPGLLMLHRFSPFFKKEPAV